MLDGTLRPRIDPILNRIAERLVRKGVTANGVTLAGFLIGAMAAIAIVFGWLLTGLALILISRLCDGLDGTVAKQTRPTDFGGYLDIVLDFAFYGMIPVAFILHDPGSNAVAGSVLVLSFYVNGASFLAFATIAEKRNLSTEARGKKSIYFTTGLAEATETLAVFCLFCLFPEWYAVIAWVFALVVFYTAFSRVMLARVMFFEDRGEKE